MRTPKEALFIFIKNRNPAEDFFGKGVFRHFESTTLKLLKEEIRNKYNEHIDGERTEEHVIHASDNELQTHMILKYLGLGGLQWLKKKHSILEVPFYVKECGEFVIKNIPIELLVCNIADGDTDNPRKRKCISIKQSPHYLALTGNHRIYQEYIDRFFRREFADYYSLERFQKLADNFEYLAVPHSTNYIAVRQLNDGRFRIIDGLHRAAIMCYKGITRLPVAVLKRG